MLIERAYKREVDPTAEQRQADTASASLARGAYFAKGSGTVGVESRPPARGEPTTTQREPWATSR